MSIIPYNPNEGREIVLRHHNAIVVRNPLSQRLEIRGLTECPTCHRPLRSVPSEAEYGIPDQHDSYVSPDYFRILRERHLDFTRERPSSPVRRTIQPSLPSNGSATPVPRRANEETFSPGPSEPNQGSRIRRDAFSQGYFKTFFVEERELGRGGKGVVLLVRHEIDGCHLGQFACKRVPVGDDHKWLEKVLIEVELLAKLSHPNLVSYRHVWLEDAVLTSFGPSVPCAFILQQYCNGGDLLNYIVGDQPKPTTKEQLKNRMRRKSRGQAEPPSDMVPPYRHLPLEEIFDLFRDITDGLRYLHQADYIHRDLKPSNCLLHREGAKLSCLISDFGEVQRRNAARTSTGTTGTISYCAPEVLRQDISGLYGNFTTKSDMFSLGMILYFMCFGRLPYRSANAIQEELEDVDQLREEIAAWKGFHDERRERPELPQKLYQLLKKLLSPNPAERPSANEVIAAMKSANPGIEARIPRTTTPALGMQSMRIQSLDTPDQSGTPILDSAKPYTPSHSSDEGDQDADVQVPASPSPRPTSHNTLQKRPFPATPRRRAPPMSLSHSEDGLARISPDRRRPLHRSPTRPARASTPLLPAPPTTMWEDMRHGVSLFLDNQSEPIMLILRVVVLLAKMISLNQICWPYTVGRLVGACLLLLAALDLIMPTFRSRRTRSDSGRILTLNTPRARWKIFFLWTGTLAVLHIVLMWICLRQSILCARDNGNWMGIT